ncbi:MAG: hypothetical protein EOO40_02510, partial [Deltaproteobacteria bacterium]
MVRQVQLAQRDAARPSSITLSLAARHLLHFAAVYAHLAGPNNRLRSAELQDNPKLDQVPSCVHQHVAARHRVTVHFLTALQHRDLAQRLGESTTDAEHAGRDLATAALRKLAGMDPGTGLFAGLDVAGAETEVLGEHRLRDGMAAFGDFAASPDGQGTQPLVLRVHAGEGYVKKPALTSEGAARGKQNIEAVLQAAT